MFSHKKKPQPAATQESVLVSKLSQENVELRAALEKSQEQVKLLTAVLRIVNEDCIQNERLETLRTNLETNPIWLDYLNTEGAELGLFHPKKHLNGLSSALVSSAAAATESKSDDVSLETKDNRSEFIRSDAEIIGEGFVLPRIAEFTGGFGSDDLFGESTGPLRPYSLKLRSMSSDDIRLVRTPPSTRDRSSIKPTTFPDVKMSDVSLVEHNCEDNEDKNDESGLAFAVGTRCLMEELPRELQTFLCGFLCFEDLCALGVSNQHWHELINEDSVWKAAFHNRWALSESAKVMAETAHEESSSAQKPFIVRLGFEDDRDELECQLLKFAQTESAELDADKPPIVCYCEGESPAPTSAPDWWLEEYRNQSGPPSEESTPSKMSSLTGGTRGTVFKHRKTWKQEFYERLQVERCWKQSRTKTITLAAHTGSVTALKFDQTKLITSSDDGSLILWRFGNMAEEWKKQMSKNRRHSRYGSSGGYDSDSSMSFTFGGSSVSRAASAAMGPSCTTSDSEIELNNSHHNSAADGIRSRSKQAKKKRLSETDYRDYAAKKNRDLVGRIRQRSQEWMEQSTVALSALSKASPATIVRNHHKTCLVNFKKTSYHGHGGPVWCLDFEPDRFDYFGSALLASGSYDKCVKLWDIHRGNCVGTLRGHDEWVSAVRIRGEHLISGSWDGTVRVWNTGLFHRHRRLDDEDPFDVTAEEEEKMMDHYQHRRRGRRLQSSAFPSSSVSSSSVMSAGGSSSPTTTTTSDTTQSCVQILKSRAGDAIYCLQWSKDKRIVFSGCRESAVQIWDLAKGMMVRTLMGHTKQIYCMDLLLPNEQESMVCTGSADQTIKLWDLRSARCIDTLTGHTGPVMSLQMDAFKLVSAGYDKTVRIFDKRKRRELHSLYGHSKAVFSMQYDMKKIVTGGADNRVLVWNFV